MFYIPFHIGPALMCVVPVVSKRRNGFSLPFWYDYRLGDWNSPLAFRITMGFAQNRLDICG